MASKGTLNYKVKTIIVKIEKNVKMKIVMIQMFDLDQVCFGSSRAKVARHRGVRQHPKKRVGKV